MAALGYDAMNLIFHAAKKLKLLTPNELQKKLASIKDFDGVTGKIRIDEKRNGIKSTVILKVDGPNHRFITTVKP